MGNAPKGTDLLIPQRLVDCRQEISRRVSLNAPVPVSIRDFHHPPTRRTIIVERSVDLDSAIENLCAAAVAHNQYPSSVPRLAAIPGPAVSERKSKAYVQTLHISVCDSATARAQFISLGESNWWGQSEAQPAWSRSLRASSYSRFRRKIHPLLRAPRRRQAQISRFRSPLRRAIIQLF